MTKNFFRLTDVTEQDGNPRHPREHPLPTLDHSRINVDVDDLAVRDDLRDDLVGVPLGWQSGADVEELPDPPLLGHPLHRALQKSTIRPGNFAHLWQYGCDLVNGFPVDRAVGGPTKVIVVHSSDKWPFGRLRVAHRYLQRRGAPAKIGRRPRNARPHPIRSSGNSMHQFGTPHANHKLQPRTR